MQSRRCLKEVYRCLRLREARQLRFQDRICSAANLGLYAVVSCSASRDVDVAQKHPEYSNGRSLSIRIAGFVDCRSAHFILRSPLIWTLLPSTNVSYSGQRLFMQLMSLNIAIGKCFGGLVASQQLSFSVMERDQSPLLQPSRMGDAMSPSSIRTHGGWEDQLQVVSETTVTSFKVVDTIPFS